jgi:hypothetical protein
LPSLAIKVTDDLYWISAENDGDQYKDGQKTRIVSTASFPYILDDVILNEVQSQRGLDVRTRDDSVDIDAEAQESPQCRSKCLAAWTEQTV